MTDADDAGLCRRLRDDLEIAGMCNPIRVYGGDVWFGRNQNLADARFVDHGAARAFTNIVRAAPELVATIERLTREAADAKTLADLSVRRMAEMAEPGFIGAFGARDAAIARALSAERRLAEVREGRAKTAEHWNVYSDAERRVARDIAAAIRSSGRESGK